MGRLTFGKNKARIIKYGRFPNDWYIEFGHQPNRRLKFRALRPYLQLNSMSRSSESEQAYEYCYDSNWMWTTDERILIQSKTSHDLQNGEKQEDSSNPLDLDSLRQTDHKSTTASENPEN
ncbi:unnamed protein product, partial [Onchocerca ochengi]|uniref:MBD domain-containing protein n=1 Tax=Onchocerca ochengi TaxID=42157 RepID=A0A182ET56_ONCOC